MSQKGFALSLSREPWDSEYWVKEGDSYRKLQLEVIAFHKPLLRWAASPNSHGSPATFRQKWSCPACSAERPSCPRRPPGIRGPGVSPVQSPGNLCCQGHLSFLDRQITPCQVHSGRGLGDFRFYFGVPAFSWMSDPAMLASCILEQWSIVYLTAPHASLYFIVTVTLWCRPRRIFFYLKIIFIEVWLIYSVTMLY